jgi:hypothetical protein
VTTLAHGVGAKVIAPSGAVRMSERSIYLRDQAAKCEWHAKHIGDTETQIELRKLAARCIDEAAAIEAGAKARLQMG